MPAGQAHTTWFPELKEILKNKWSSNLSIEQHFDLVDDFNKLLRKWKKYSKSENIDIYAYEKVDKNIVKNNDSNKVRWHNKS